jgi:hypothetical protein
MIPPLLHQQILDEWWDTDHIDEVRIEVGEPRSIFASESNLINPAHQLLLSDFRNHEAYLAFPSPANSRPTG